MSSSSDPIWLVSVFLKGRFSSMGFSKLSPPGRSLGMTGFCGGYNSWPFSRCTPSPRSETVGGTNGSLYPPSCSFAEIACGAVDVEESAAWVVPPPVPPRTSVVSMGLEELREEVVCISSREIEPCASQATASSSNPPSVQANQCLVSDTPSVRSCSFTLSISPRVLRRFRDCFRTELFWDTPKMLASSLRVVEEPLAVMLRIWLWIRSMVGTLPLYFRRRSTLVASSTSMEKSSCWRVMN